MSWLMGMSGLVRWVIGCLFVLAVFYPVASHSQPNVEDVETAKTNGNGITALTSEADVDTPGANRLLLALLSVNSPQDMTSCTFNGSQSMTLLVEFTSGNLEVQIWYLIAPTSTTSAVVSCSLSASADNNTILMTTIALSNASQSPPTLTNTNSCASCTTVNAGLTSTVNNTLMVTVSSHNIGTATHTHGTGQDERSDFGDTGTGPQDATSTSTELKVTAGAETLSTTASTSAASFAYVVAGIEPAAAVTGRRKATPIRMR